MTIEARRIQRGVGAGVLALALILIAAVPIARADTIYPDNVITGSHFSTGLSHPGGSGWTAVSNTCTLLIGLIPTNEPNTCNADTTHAAGIGTPPGSLQQSYSPPANGLGALLFNATTLAESSTFTIATGGPTTFQFDRRADVQALLNFDSVATYTFTLVNLTAATRTELFSETLTDEDNVFQGQLRDAAPAPGGLANVIAGNVYKIEIKTVFQTRILSAALQNTIVNFDNLRLRVQDGTPGFGAPTAQTEPATDINAVSATLNGRTNARGTPSTYTFQYGTSPTLAGATTIGPFSAGTNNTFQDRSRPVTGLSGCTTYYFRIAATNAQGSDNGSIRSFKTDCKPTADTLDVTGIGAGAATFNSRINPNGPETKYWYEYGTVASGGFGTRVPAVGAELVLAAGRSDVLPNSYPVSGLAPETDYQVHVVAMNSIGTTIGTTKPFRTAGTGAQGPTGSNGTNGTNGSNGTNGLPGTAGAPGLPGVVGNSGSGGPVIDLDSSSKLAMIRIDAQRITVPLRGRNKGRVRVRIYCRSIAVRTCSGNMKVRTINKINPQGLGFPVRPKRKVTWETSPVQLDVRKIGFAILTFPTQRLSLLRRVKQARSEAIVSVIDADNNRQNVRKVVTVVAGR